MADLDAQLKALAARKLPLPQLRQQLTRLRADPAVVGLFALEHGVFELAHAQLSSALHARPTHCAVAVGLARAKARLGDVQSAIALIDAAADLHPDDHDAARWSIQLRRDNGRLPGAARKAAAVLGRQPDNGFAWSTAAPVFEQMGEHKMAEHAWRRAVALDPERRWAWFHLGTMLLQRGRFTEAAHALRKARALGEPNAIVMTNLGTALVHAGQLQAAQNVLERAVELDPQHLQARLMLAQLRATLSHDDAADTLYTDLLVRAPDHIGIRLAYTDFLISVGRSKEAEQHLHQILSRKANHPAATIALGRLHTRRGQHAEAVARLSPFMGPELEAANTICDFARSCIRTGQPERALPIVVGRSQRRCTPTQAQHLHHTLGQLHEAMGAYKAAFEAHQTGNRHRERDIDPAPILAEFRETARALPGLPELAASPSSSAKPSTDTGDQGPGQGVVFIVGMLRSGTSLTEQILASHPQVTPGGELPSLSQVLRPLAAGDPAPGAWARALAGLSTDACHDLGRAYIADAARRAGTTPDAVGRVIVTDKQPTNFLMLGAITRILPGARIIHCRRDPLDTCLSCFFQNFGPGHAYTTELGWMGAVYRGYRQQMHWWTERCGIAVTPIDYEQLVNDTEPSVRRLLAAVGLPFDPACLSFHTNRRDVRTASVDQVRRPIYSSSVGRAERYAPWLQPLRDALGDLDDLPLLLDELDDSTPSA